MNLFLRTTIRVGLSLLIVGGGVVAMKALVDSRPAAEVSSPTDLGVVVRTQVVQLKKQPATVATQGLVVPAEEVSLQPEVQGRVVYRSENLVPGGRFKKGDVLLRIDASEYSLRAKQSATQVEQAQQQYFLEQSRGEIAAHEWKLIGEDGQASEAGRSVALREPQKRDAEARIELAEQARGLAVINVGRTTLRAPFNGFVRSGLVNVGQYISPARSLGTLVGSDEFWVQVSIPVERLSSFHIPGFNAEQGAGSTVSVWQELEGEKVSRTGRVIRLYGDVDPAGRMARVLARIDDPLGLDAKVEARGLPLLLGAYVHIEIEGNELIDVVEVPRAAVHSGRYVYVFGPEGRLEIRDVAIAWRKEKSFLLSSGVGDGEEIITSRLGTAIDGLKVRRVKAGAAGGTLKGAQVQEKMHEKHAIASADESDSQKEKVEKEVSQ